MEFKFNYRKPSEFYGLGNGVLRAWAIWFLMGWHNNCCDVWIDTGARFLGLEFNCRKYLP